MDLSPVTYMAPADLVAALDGSVDSYEVECPVLECASGNDCEDRAHWGERLHDLLGSKLDECSRSFIDSLIYEGIEKPICIQVWMGEEGEMTWIHGNGHHRTAVALNEGIAAIPVVFAFDGDFMHDGVTGGFDTSAGEWDDDWNDEDSNWE